MDHDLSALDEKIDQMLALCQSLRAENQDLRTRVAALEAEKRRLDEKVDTARARLEALMEKLPQA